MLLLGDIRCIRVIGFLRLKPGFRGILSSNAQKCGRKVRPYKPCTSVASESKLDHANRILHLKLFCPSSRKTLRGDNSDAPKTLLWFFKMPGFH